MKHIQYIKQIVFILLIASCQSGYSQSPYHLQQLHHLKIKGLTSGVWPRVFMNENGWVFFDIGGIKDTFNFQSLTLDSTQLGAVLVAIDNQMRLRWSFVYRQGVNTTQGGMGIIGVGPDNSVYFTCGAKDSLILPGLEPIYNVASLFNGRIDSSGNFIHVAPTGIGFWPSFGAYPIAGGKIATMGDRYPFILNPDLSIEVVETGVNSNSAISATIQPDGSAFGLAGTSSGGSLNLLDTFIPGDIGVYKWIFYKVKNGKREWTHVINNNLMYELNENKLIRYDKYGNIFVAIQHRQAIQVAGTTIPYYTEGNTTLVTKASILRFAPDGTLLSVHHDTSQAVPFSQNRQTIWLENDKDMNVYAYLFSSGRTYYFDKIDFGDAYSRKNKILTYNYTTNSFDKAWYFIPPTTDGNIAQSNLSNRQVFWYRYLSDGNTFFTESDEITIMRVWKDDKLVAIYDTLPPTGPIVSVQMQSAIHPPIISIYPNPSNEVFTIHNNMAGAVRCKVYSIEGKQMEEFEMQAGASRHFGEWLHTGVYFVEATNQSGERYTLRILKH